MRLLSCLIAVLLSGSVFAQVAPASVTIARDSFGVPHIFAATDAAVAYGLAWAHCEDDFRSVQQNLLQSRSLLGEVDGKSGVLFDYAMQFFGIDTFVDHHYEQSFSPEFKAVLAGYIQGVNSYAAAHPGQVLVRRVLPFTTHDLIRSYTLNLTLFAGAGIALKSIKENRIEFFHQPNEIGSNAMAIAPSRTEDGRTWLAVNSHQPLEGRFAWYEAHLCSEEGLDVIGGLFPGGVSVFVGSNQHLGWAHTTNYHNFGDIYQLQRRGNKYFYDGQWRRFETRTAHLRIRLGKIVLPVSKKIRYSVQGPVFSNKKGSYALRFPGYQDIRAAEQWYHMDKARNWSEFEKAIRMEAIPLFNIVYGDREGHIFWQSGCQVPLRDTAIRWHQPVPGTSSQYVWQKLLPYDRKPALLDPACGFVYSCNQTPLATSGTGCNWRGYFPGMQLFTYNRGERFGEMLNAIPGKISWQQFLDVKFDKHYAQDGTYARNFRALYHLDAAKYPDLAAAIAKLQHWDWSGTVDNKDAALAMLTHEYLMKKLNGPFAFLMIKKDTLTTSEVAEALRHAQDQLIKTHGSIDVPLGEVQRLIRGTVSIPASGLREVARAADAKLVDKKKGIYKVTSGDGYIQLVKFGKDGVDLRTISPYGASADPASPHYTDQMRMFEREEFKQMTFDKAEILRKAERVYHPE